jgi:hypothetical protein
MQDGVVGRPQVVEVRQLGGQHAPDQHGGSVSVGAAQGAYREPEQSVR